MSAITIHHPPFPPLTVEHGMWNGEVVIPFWRDYQAWQPQMEQFNVQLAEALRRQGLVSTIPLEEPPANGRFYISIKTGSFDEHEPIAPPTESQAGEYQYFLDNQETISQAVLNAIVAYMEEESRREWWLELFDDAREYRRHVRGLKGLDKFRRLIGPHTIHLPRGDEAGVASLGMQFSCAWDEEHGCGVLTRRGEVIEVGHADVSF